MLEPEIPVPKRNKVARMTMNCNGDGKPNMRKVVKNNGDIYTIPRSPLANNLPTASSVLVIGKLSM